jgi:aminoglycoside phosphotransferase (APT) family kinase protein
MHDDEVAIDDALVRRLVDAQLPRWSHLGLRRVASTGTDNALFRLGEGLVVRLPRIGWAVDDVAKEQAWLPRLAPLLPVAVPRPVALGEPGSGYPWQWSVYEWLHGEGPARDHLREPERLALDLAAFVRALHGVDLPGGPAATRGIPLAERDLATRAAIRELADVIDVHRALTVWESALAAAAWSAAPVWVHGDLSPGNVLLRGDRLHAVIDFGGVGVGDPACDLMPAWNLLPREVRARFRDALGTDQATWRRGRGWALSVAVIALPYYRTRSSAIVERELRVVAEVVADVDVDDA